MKKMLLGITMAVMAGFSVNALADGIDQNNQAAVRNIDQQSGDTTVNNGSPTPGYQSNNPNNNNNMNNMQPAQPVNSTNPNNNQAAVNQSNLSNSNEPAGQANMDNQNQQSNDISNSPSIDQATNPPANQNNSSY